MSNILKPNPTAKVKNTRSKTTGEQTPNLVGSWMPTTTNNKLICEIVGQTQGQKGQLKICNLLQLKLNRTDQL